jgi:hypothetical protein
MSTRGVTRNAMIAGTIGLVLSVLGTFVDPRQAYASYLTAYAAGLSLAVGALMLVMTAQVTGARWFVPFRPIALRISSTLPLFALLFLLLLPGLRVLYPWVPPLDHLSPELQQEIHQKQSYLNVPGFVVRALIYFLVWIGFGRLIRRSPRVASAAGLPVVGLTVTFAAFDWLMSLTPDWFSTIYGLYYFAGGFLAALALVALLAHAGERFGSSAPLVGERYHALGKMLLTFVLFWAYVAYAQLLIVWIADLPKEITWYVPRLHGSWGVLGLVLLGGQFVIPFLLLLFRRVTTQPHTLALIGGWLLLMHYLDVYWLVLPTLRPGGVVVHWLDLAGVLLVGGFAVAYGGRIRPETLLLPETRARSEESYAV